jgi:hypothetical protein
MSVFRHRTRLKWLAVLLGLTFAFKPQTFQSSAFAETTAECLDRQVHALSQEAASYRTRGVFVPGSESGHEELGHRFLSAGVVKPIEGGIKRVASGDLALDLNQLKPAQMEKLLDEGKAEESGLYYLTSGAGLWSRGGGQVKALIPFNIKELLSAQDFQSLVTAGEIANASKPEDVLKLAGHELRAGGDPAKQAEAIVAERRLVLTHLIHQARSEPKAITPIDIKLVNVALQSEAAKTYIPFDIWTSGQTHEPIREYLSEFEKNYRAKVFHSNPMTDAKIKDALGKYFAESAKRGETHLFGYQVGYHALDVITGKPVLNSPMIGEGAGMAKAYLDQSGRTAELQKMGKSTWVFENIEVVTDLPLAMGAHVRSGKAVSVILVPEKEGYKGGSPFLVNRNGKSNLELHEMSALPQEFANGNQYFNSNTIFQGLSLSPPKNIGFEVKNFNGRKVARAKMNAGDITLEAPTAGIGGRIGVEYENFKNYGEFGQNGQTLIETFQNIWTRDTSGP